MAFTGFLKQSTIATISIGPLVAASDGDAEQTGKTVQDTDFFLSKGGGAKANPNDTNDATEDANGVYRKQLNATDTNTLGILTVYIHFTSSLYLKQDYAILPVNVYDSFFSTDKLQVDAVQWLGSAVTLSTGNQPDVNVDRIDDVAVSGIATDGKLHVLDDSGNAVAPANEYNTQLDANMSTRSSHNAAAVKTAMEAANGDLDLLVRAKVNKLIITKANGDIEMFDDADSSLGTVSTATTDDGTYITRLRMKP